MTNIIDMTFNEYKDFVIEYFPKSTFSCSENTQLIKKTFKLVEITDIFNEYLGITNYTDYIQNINHQCLLMLYNFPNYNAFFSSAIQRSISETILRMNLICIGEDHKNSNEMPFFRIQERLKNNQIYTQNKNNFKISSDLFFSYYGKNSMVIHNDTLEKRTSINYLKAFNTIHNNKEFLKLSNFIDKVLDYFLLTFSSLNNLNDYTFNLPSKIKLKKVIGTQEYNIYFNSK